MSNSQLMHDIAGFTADPLAFSRYIYPWAEGELEDSKGPRQWQSNLLKSVAEHLGNPATQYTPFQASIASGHGIGKSAFVGMFTHWAMSTCEDCRVVITANSDPQLRTKTWPEVSKWFRLGLNSKWFLVNAETITIKNEQHAGIWRTDRLTWSTNNPQAFAGLHNKGKRIVVIFDEASEIDDVIWEVTQGALTDENTEIIWLVFGNPTQNTGRFCECFGKYRHRWKNFQIDSRTVEGTNKVEIDKWIKDYGEDSDFVRVRVRGEFPRAGSNQFIPSDLVVSARLNIAEGFQALPKILSIDVARFGDDQTVIGLRQGRHFRILSKYRGMDTVQTTRYAIDFIEKENPDAIVVDGDGLGAGVVDNLKHRGYEDKLFEFHGGETAKDPEMYYNRRAEVWGLTRDWLKEGAEIPNEPEMETDLTGPQYGFSAKQQLQLEKKEDMKKRGLASPDFGDCLAMTFSVQLAQSRSERIEERVQHRVMQIKEPSEKLIHYHRIMLEERAKVPKSFPIRRPRRHWASN